MSNGPDPSKIKRRSDGKFDGYESSESGVRLPEIPNGEGKKFNSSHAHAYGQSALQIAQLQKQHPAEYEEAQSSFDEQLAEVTGPDEEYEQLQAKKSAEAEQYEHEQTDRFNSLITTKRNEAEHAQAIVAQLRGHDLYDELREHGISRVDVTDESEPGRQGEFSVQLYDAEGAPISDDESGLEDAIRSEYDFDELQDIGGTNPYSFSEDAILDVSKNPGGKTRDQLRAQRDKIVRDAEPQGPRAALLQHIGDPENPGYLAAVEALDAADGIDESPNAVVDEVDRKFADDVDKRKLVREVSEGLENRYQVEYDDQGPWNRAHQYAADRVAEGRTDSDRITDEAAAVCSVDLDLEREYGDDIDTWSIAMDDAEQRIENGADAEQAFWGAKDRIEDLKADGKLR